MRQTDRRQTKHRLMPPPYGGGGVINAVTDAHKGKSGKPQSGLTRGGVSFYQFNADILHRRPYTFETRCTRVTVK